jgi:small subunit ribosomal protein S20
MTQEVGPQGPGEEKKAVKKRLSTKKRQRQNSKRRVENRAFRQEVRTAIRRFKESVQTKDEAKQNEALQDVYSFMDKGVKKSIFKKNKASRIKGRMMAYLHATKKAQ